MAAQMKAMEDRPYVHVVGLERPARVPAGAIPCALHRELIVDSSKLAYYCSSTLDARADDLVVLAGVVAFADRAVRRATSRSWMRAIHITVPVLDVAFWRQPDVDSELRSVLNLLTGDAWRVSFCARRQRLDVDHQHTLDFGVGAPPVVMPYSDGMDSLVVARLLNDSEPATRLVMVTTGRRRDPDAPSRKAPRGGDRFRFAVPFRTTARNEPSYRSRALIYGTMGAIAAKLTRSRRIVVAESGQGALGPWLAPVGNEAVDLRMNPIFTSQFAAFVGRVLGFECAFEHPRLPFTKGQTLKELVERKLDAAVLDTRSCARDARAMSLDGKLIQCGVCAACLLRRVSVREAGLEESEYAYLWSDLTAPSLDEAVQAGGRRATANDIDQAVCGALSLKQLANVPRRSLPAKAWELARSLKRPEGEVLSLIEALVEQHAQEWRRFVDAQGSRSFLRVWA